MVARIRRTAQTLPNITSHDPRCSQALGAVFGGSAAMVGEGEEEMVVPGAQGEFYPYVYTAIETEPNVS